MDAFQTIIFNKIIHMLAQTKAIAVIMNLIHMLNTYLKQTQTQVEIAIGKMQYPNTQIVCK